jgi:hypothetical protein
MSLILYIVVHTHLLLLYIIPPYCYALGSLMHVACILISLLLVLYTSCPVVPDLLSTWKIMIAGVSPTAIAVQSPYIAQVQLLREKLEKYPGLSAVEVSTIDSFHGREADAVIISMVSTVPDPLHF